METEELMRAVKRQFGDETGSQIEDDDIFRWINEGQFQISRRTGSAEVSTSIPFTLNGSVYNHKYNLPVDFFKFKFVELDGRRLQGLQPEQLATMYPELDSTSAQSGFSKFYSVSRTATNQSQITVAPIPGQAGNLEVTYIRKPPLVRISTDDLTIPEEFHNTLLTFCLAKAKQLDGDDEASMAMAAQFKAEVQEDSHDEKHKDEGTYPFIRASMGDTWS